jgi:metallopeptidase MepB
MAPSKYLKPPQAPPLFTATAASLVKDAQALCDHTRAMLDKIAKDVTPQSATFANVVLPMAEDENTAGLEARIIGFYQAVSTNQELRDASSKAEEIMDEFNIEASMREDMFKLVDAAYQKGEDLDPESKRLLEKERKSYIRNGLGIPAGPKRDRFKDIKKRLSMIQIEFQKNLNEESGGIWFTPEELAGVPEDVMSGLEKGSGENAGKVKLSFKYPDLFPTLKFATNPDTRKRVFIDNENKVAMLRNVFPNLLADTHSAMRTRPSSRKLLFCVMKLPGCSVTKTMRLSGSRTRWPKPQRLSTSSWMISELSWLLAERRRLST